MMAQEDQQPEQTALFDDMGFWDWWVVAFQFVIYVTNWIGPKIL